MSCHDYFSTDEFADVYHNLILLELLLTRVESCPNLWKWIIVCAHNTLQGASVCLLTNTAGVGALSKESTKETLKSFDTEKGPENEFPMQRLAPLSQLLLRLPKELSCNLKDIHPPHPFDVEGDLKRLQEFRDNFIHFTPKSWSIELAGLPRVTRHCLEYIEKIAMHPDYKRYNHFSELPVRKTIADIRELLIKLQNQFGN